jgi:serine/threonine-protein kinase
VLDVGTTESGAPYMIMEYLAGRDLAAELAARGPLPIAEAVGYVLQACEGMADAHRAGVVHRDLKPANLFLTRDRDGKKIVKVLDFGVSKITGASLALTHEMAVIGSPYYMSPEQIDASRDVDARTDVWALGVTLYELVAGKTPFHADELTALSVRIWLRPPTPLATHRTDAPPGFEAVLAKCFEEDREERLPSVAALAAELVPFGPPGAAELARETARTLARTGTPSAAPHDVGTALAPAQAAAATGTGTAVMKAATPLPRGRKLARVGAALGVAALVGGATLWWRLAAPASRVGGPAPAASPSTAASEPVPDASPHGVAPDASTMPAIVASTRPVSTGSATHAPGSKTAPHADPTAHKDETPPSPKKKSAYDD